MTDDDLSPPSGSGWKENEEPEQPARPERATSSNKAPLANIAPRSEPRGIGPDSPYKREPIGAVVEILKRGFDAASNKWIMYPPFDRSTPKDAKWAFGIMTPTTVTTRSAGTRENPARAPHPDFAAFNSCDPDLAQNFGLVLVHFEAPRAWKFYLGAYKAPAGRTGPATGWWCKGDGVTAVRCENGKEFSIKCPNRMCEFSQEGSGQGGKGTHCKTHTSLIGQFNWSAKSPLPRIMFQWDSQSYHAYENVESVFRLVRETAAQFNIPNLPVIGLPIRLSVKQTIKKGKRYPEVHASIDGSIMEHIAKVRAAAAEGQIVSPQQLSGAPSLRELPPPGMTQDDVDRAAQTRLNPNYRPQNER